MRKEKGFYETHHFLESRRSFALKRLMRTTACIFAIICMVALLGMAGCAQAPNDSDNSLEARNSDISPFYNHQENADKTTPTEEGAEDISEEDAQLIMTARETLNVPTDRAIVCSLGKEYYWEEGQQYLQSVSFLEDGELCAGADCAQDGTPIRNIVPY